MTLDCVLQLPAVLDWGPGTLGSASGSPSFCLKEWVRPKVRSSLSFSYSICKMEGVVFISVYPSEPQNPLPSVCRGLTPSFQVRKWGLETGKGTWSGYIAGDVACAVPRKSE